MHEDIDLADAVSDAAHPDNDIATYQDLIDKFCRQISNTDFSSVINETEGFNIYLTAVIENSAASTPTVDVTAVDDKFTIGIGFKKTSNPTC
jgi:hypothetical protein